jgi:hypothetical protein
MGFKARERKRQRKASARASAAQGRDQKRARSDGTSSAKWWLTPLQSKCCCNRTILRVGTSAVYRHTPREVLCLRSADREKVPWRPSARWEKANRRRRQQRLAA